MPLSLPSVCHPPLDGSAGGQMHLSNNGCSSLSPLVVHRHDCSIFHCQYLRQAPAVLLLAVVADQSVRIDPVKTQSFCVCCQEYQENPDLYSIIWFYSVGKLKPMHIGEF